MENLPAPEGVHKEGERVPLQTRAAIPTQTTSVKAVPALLEVFHKLYLN